MLDKIRLTGFLQKANPLVFSFYAAFAAFATYFCMYAFRKPFAVGTFENLYLWGIDYKILLVVAQVLGYTLSKFWGIKIISEMKSGNRALGIVIFIAIAELALLFFGLTPYPYNFIFLFINGIPLGLIWGLVFSFLEGRRVTEILAAGLSVSFIISSGVVKSAGKWLMQEYAVNQFWMPALVGLLFFIPLLISTWMLAQIPKPNEQDEQERTKRVPMQKAERRAFFKKFAPGIIFLVIIYMFFTAFRDFRDNFAVELWSALGYSDAPSVFTFSEIPITIIVLIILGVTMFIKDNKKAFWVNHLIILTGILFMGLGTFLFEQKIITPYLWMISVGLGLYLGYTPFNSILFERFIATFKYKSNAGFLIYIADAFGYLASILVLGIKNFATPDISWLSFFVSASYIIMIITIILILLSFFYFYRKAIKIS